MNAPSSAPSLTGQGAGPTRVERHLSGPSTASPEATHDSLPPRAVIGLACLALAIVVIATGAAYVFAMGTPETFGARAELVYQLDPTTDRDTAARQLATQVVTIRSRAVLEPVAIAEGLPVEELAQDVSASVIEESTVVAITIEAASREVALRRVVAIAEQYRLAATSYFNEAPEQLMRERETALTTRLGEIQALLPAFDAAREEAARLLRPAPPQTADERALLAESEQLLQELSTLRQQLLTAQAQRLTAPQPRLLTEPYLLDEPVSPQPMARAALGAMVGIAIAVIVVIALARRRRQLF